MKLLRITENSMIEIEMASELLQSAQKSYETAGRNCKRYILVLPLKRKKAVTKLVK